MPAIKDPGAGNPQVIDPLQIPRRHEFMPIDMMVQPSKTNSLLEMAKALSQVNPRLNNFLAQQNDGINQAALESGKQSAVKTGLAYAEAVKRGLIKPNDSPFFMAGYNEQNGRLQGSQIAAQGYQDWIKDPVRNSNNQQDIIDWTNKKVQDATKGVTDPAVLQGMMPELQRFQQEMPLRQADYRAQQVKQGAIDNAQSELGGAVHQELSDAAHQGRAFNPMAIQSAWERVKQETSMMGLSRSELTGPYVQSVIQAARATGNVDLLDVLNKDNADGSKGPGTIPQYGDAIIQAKHAILTEEKQNESWSHEKDMWDRQERVRKAESTLVMDPTNKDAFAQLVQDDPTRAQTWKDHLAATADGSAFAKHTSLEDSSAIATNIYGPNSQWSMSDLIDYAHKHPIGESDFNAARDHIAAKDKPGTKSIFNAPEVQLVARDLFGDINHPALGPLMADHNKMTAAMTMWGSQMIGFQQTNPNATPQEVFDYTTKLEKQIKDRYGNDELSASGTSGKTVNTETNGAGNFPGSENSTPATSTPSTSTATPPPAQQYPMPSTKSLQSYVGVMGDPTKSAYEKALARQSFEKFYGPEQADQFIPVTNP
jgi:hypothetical protein